MGERDYSVNRAYGLYPGGENMEPPWWVVAGAFLVYGAALIVVLPIWLAVSLVCLVVTGIEKALGWWI